MPDRLQHQLISASAGSGKTYQLVRRYLHLLALGQAGEGIAAMTFTRKAAGEFFSRILQRLAEMAEHPDQAEAFFEGCSPPVPPGQSYVDLLRRITRRLHRLRLGTMDSFFAIVAACFPMELGLVAGARVMDEDETRQARREALDALLEKLYAEEEGTAQQILMEAHKQATFGAEEKTVDQALRGWLEKGLALWEDSTPAPGGHHARDLRGWGEMARIWPQKLELGSLAEAIAEVRATFQPLNAAGEELLEETLTQVLECVPGLTPPKRVTELLKKAEEQWNELLAGDAELMWMRKKTPVRGAAARALVKLVQTLMTREFLVRANRTAGVASVMDLMAREYAGRVRARGRLSFADVQRLLCQAVRAGAGWSAGGEGELWFRLDGRYQHWLLDEFQDTSRVQWQVIGALVDEVIQDAEGLRSFFAVGDPKQSIYLWRQAEPDLFDDILRTYPAAEGRGLNTGSLSQSFRSSPAVLEAVNTAFGNRSTLESLLPEGALKGFAFQPHTPARPQLSGHAALISPLAGLETEEPPVTWLAGQLLLQIRPLERGLSCAILVRSNREAQRLTEQLRALTGMEILCESNLHPCTDNSVTLALLSLLTLAAHPGDRMAREHLRMTPLWSVISSPDHPLPRILEDIQHLVVNRGFAAFMETWTPRLRQVHPELDAFHSKRLAQMADIAAEYDAVGQRDLDAFLDYAREYPLRMRGGSKAVQVMTVHASKGLEFDVVILPDLDGIAMDASRHEGYLVSRTTQGVEWVLETPPKAFAKLDATLTAVLEENRRRTAFESLCRLYVAMTRARLGLYMLAGQAPKDGKALKEARMLRQTLGSEGQGRPFPTEDAGVVEWETGKADWYEDHKLLPVPEVAPEPEAVEEFPPLGALLRKTQPQPRRRTPSGEETFTVPGAVLFGEGRDPGRRLGTLVHELFAEVEWSPELPALESVWLARGLLQPDDLVSLTGPVAEALAMVRAVLRTPECAAAFTAPGPHAQVWRERSFDLVIEGEWITGTFDRVILDRDEEGRCTGAWIVDFKTDRVADDNALQEKLAGYAPQLALYRQAIARLVGLPVAAVRTSLLFTRMLRLVEVVPQR